MGGPGSGAKPRKYPAEIVDLACGMYLAGMTVAEIRAVFPKGYRVQTILERHLPERRPTGKRDQRGEKNHAWKADDLGYGAAHWRIYMAHGSASNYRCDCGAPAKDWSYDGGCPREKRDPETGCRYSPNVSYYTARCRKCHRAHDKEMRDAA